MALKGVNEDEIEDLVRFAHGRGFDLTLIETMPLGDIDGDRTDQYLPLSIVRARLMDRFTLEDIPYRTGGPARYVRVKETGGRLGFITPMTHNFCESCNRVRLTCTGTLYMCLGQDDAADLRSAAAGHRSDDALLSARHRRGHRAQAQGPRLRHRPAHQAAGRPAAHERDRRLSRNTQAPEAGGTTGWASRKGGGRAMRRARHRARPSRPTISGQLRLSPSPWRRSPVAIR